MGYSMLLLASINDGDDATLAAVVFLVVVLVVLVFASVGRLK